VDSMANQSGPNCASRPTPRKSGAVTSKSELNDRIMARLLIPAFSAGVIWLQPATRKAPRPERNTSASITKNNAPAPNIAITMLSPPIS
jgi:hypothetical protein